MSTQTRMAGPEVVGHASAWTVHLSALAGLIIALVLLYWHSVAAAVTVWWVSPTFSHCFLIIPVMAYLIWGKRSELAAITPVIHPRALLLTAPLIAASSIGALASVNEIQQLSFIGFVQVLTLTILGPHVYRKILFPSLFLFFLVPMGEYLIGPLQRFTTWFIDVWLGLLGILHHTEGNVIELTNGSYQVAEACAGLRFLIATIAVGTLFAHFTYRKWQKVLLFMIACVIVPIIGNGFRALGIVLLAHFSNNRIAVGADHLVYGWGFSVAILAVLMWVGTRFADKEEQSAEPSKFSPVRAPLSRSFGLTVLAALVAMALVPGFEAWRAQAAPIDAVAFGKPPAISGWSVGAASLGWSPWFLDPDASLKFSMRQDSLSPPVDVFVDYYANEGGGHNLISSTNKMWNEDQWHPVLQDQVDAKLGSQPVRLVELQIANPGTSLLIWWTYASAGRFTTSGMQVKLDKIRTALAQDQGSALIAISTTMDSGIDAARTRLRRAAAGLGSLGDRVDGAKRTAQR